MPPLPNIHHVLLLIEIGEKYKKKYTNYKQHFGEYNIALNGIKEKKITFIDQFT